MTDIIDLVRQSPNYSEGQSDADRDFAKGKLAQRDFGPSPSWWEDVINFLQGRYQITFEPVDITADHGLIARSIGYNERMCEYIRAKFGQDVVSIAIREAENRESGGNK